jgi:pimeloyl-ACP methyl ester carboxylesterase
MGGRIGRRVLVGLAAVAVTAGLGTPALAAAGGAGDGSNGGAGPEIVDYVNDPGPGCAFVDTTVPKEVVDAQLAPLPQSALEAEDQFTIHGGLCLPEGGVPKTVMLALHGITYTNLYWNAGYEPNTYNFSQHMTDAGYAVYAVDRLGYGESSKPNALAVTLDSGAEVAHQLITQLRAGGIGGEAFEHLILVGHSYGTATSWRESAIYNDADAIIGTGWANSIETEPLARFFGGFVPAQQDPRFADRPLDYFTPNYAEPREQDFLYDLSNADPGMIAYDEEVMQDTVTAGEGLTFYNRYGEVRPTSGLFLQRFPMTSDPIEFPLADNTQAITIPSFLINGSEELFFCGTDQLNCASSMRLQFEEADFWREEACFRAAVTPHAGHDLNLQRNAPFTYETIVTFADDVLGPDGANKESYLAECQAFSGKNTDPTGPARFGAVRE